MSSQIVKGTTCFSEHSKYNIACKKQSCKYWINCGDNLNCTMVAANKKEMTLQEIGDIFNLTRMRICQIEKIIFAKINSKLKNHDVATL